MDKKFLFFVCYIKIPIEIFWHISRPLDTFFLEMSFGTKYFLRLKCVIYILYFWPKVLFLIFYSIFPYIIKSFFSTNWVCERLQQIQFNKLTENSLRSQKNFLTCFDNQIVRTPLFQVMRGRKNRNRLTINFHSNCQLAKVSVNCESIFLIFWSINWCFFWTCNNFPLLINSGDHDQLKMRPYFLPWVSKNIRYVSTRQS